MSASPPIDYSALPAGRLTQAHNYFSTAIGDWLDEDPAFTQMRATVLVPTIATRLQIVSIQLLANEDAQEIIETLNARGTPLTTADLIKNFACCEAKSDGAFVNDITLRKSGN